MDWINGLFSTNPAAQTVIVLSMITAAGLALGKLHVRGISLGIAFVFFIGIIAGQLGFCADPMMVSFAETFGLLLFVYNHIRDFFVTIEFFLRNSIPIIHFYLTGMPFPHFSPRHAKI